MKCMIVYYIGGKWYGEEVAWKRSGSGTYREISRIEIPQSKEEIEAFGARTISASSGGARSRRDGSPPDPRAGIADGWQRTDDRFPSVVSYGC